MQNNLRELKSSNTKPIEKGLCILQLLQETIENI